MVHERLMAYGDRNLKLPTHIIYYRDGVDEAQRAKVRDEEVPAIKAAYHQIAVEKKLAILDVPVTAVIVAKRHNTRLFPTSGPPNALPNGNVLPGTVVDSCITSPFYFDYFMVSHASIQGSAKPAHYFVVKNDLGFSAEQLQDFVSPLDALFLPSAHTISTRPVFTNS